MSSENEQADREWAKKRAKRLPELDVKQRRLAKQLEQLRTKLDDENSVLNTMKGLDRMQRVK